MASNPSSSRVTPIVIWGSAIVLVILAVFAVRSFTRERLVVRVAQVAPQDLLKTSSTNGKVEPVEDFKATAQVPGQVHDLYVKVGDHVKPGQLLLRLDDSENLSNLAHAQSTLKSSEISASDVQQGGTQQEKTALEQDLNRAKMQLQQDTVSLQSLQNLQQSGAASAGEVAAAKHRVDMDNANIQNLQQRAATRYGKSDQQKAQAAVQDARAAVAAAQSSLSKTEIRSPLAGSVYYLPVSRFDTVAVGDDLISVADLTRLRVLAYFDEPEVGALANGQPVKIVWEARPDKVWHGHVSQVPTTIISYGTRNVGECYITVDDADGTLQPNANVTVTVTTVQHNHVLAVPRESLHFDGPQAFVYRVVNGKLVRANVQPGIVNYTWAEIIRGLTEGDTVARNATTNRDLANGLEVKTTE